MRILVLSIGDYKHITLISKYTTYFESNNLPYDVICLDKYGSDVKREHVLSYRAKNDSSKIGRIMDFFRFKKWATKKIKEKDYDFIIVWNENTALLFSFFLLRRYAGKYVVNIRDVDFLNQRILNKIRARVIRKSAFSTYCSTAGLFFPKNYQYVLMRSTNLDVLSKTTRRNKLVKNRPIRIMYLGKVRFFDADEKIIKAFGNDKRFELWFVGIGSEKLKKYTKSYRNLHLVGQYEPEETAKYLQEADVINSYFGTSVLGHDKMSSIRFSYAPFMNVPVIVGANTNMEKEGKEYGFAYGFGHDDVKDEAESFYKWYSNIGQTSFMKGCEKYRRDCRESDEIFYKELEKALKHYGKK